MSVKVDASDFQKFAQSDVTPLDLEELLKPFIEKGLISVRGKSSCQVVPEPQTIRVDVECADGSLMRYEGSSASSLVQTLERTDEDGLTVTLVLRKVGRTQHFSRHLDERG